MINDLRFVITKNRTFALQYRVSSDEYIDVEVITEEQEKDEYIQHWKNEDIEEIQDELEYLESCDKNRQTRNQIKWLKELLSCM